MPKRRRAAFFTPPVAIACTKMASCSVWIAFSSTRTLTATHDAHYALGLAPRADRVGLRHDDRHQPQAHRSASQRPRHRARVRGYMQAARRQLLYWSHAVLRRGQLQSRLGQPGCLEHAGWSRAPHSQPYAATSLRSTPKPQSILSRLSSDRRRAITEAIARHVPLPVAAQCTAATAAKSAASAMAMKLKQLEAKVQA